MKEIMTEAGLAIEGRVIGRGKAPYVIAEVAMNHDGSLGMAHAFIDACAAVGVDCIKYQTRIAAAESTLDEAFRVPLTSQDATRFDYWRRMEFGEDQWRELREHALQRGIGFLSTPFSIEALELLERVGVAAWKVGSGELTFTPLIRAMAATGKPVLLSTGMATWEEIDRAVEIVAPNKSFGVFQCTSQYPLPMSNVGLNLVKVMQQRYRCPVGLSDHSGSVFPAMAAMATGAAMIEVHVTMDKRAFGPDVSSSLTVDEVGQVAAASRAMHEMLSASVDKDEIASQLAPTKKLFSRSVGVKHRLSAGEFLAEKQFAAKRPGTGIPFEQAAKIVGRRLKRNVTPERLLRWEDIE